MRTYTLLLVLFLHSCTADINNATVIPLDTWVQRTAPATGFDNVCFNTTAPDQEIRLQFIGPAAPGNRAVLEYSIFTMNSQGTATNDIVYINQCPINITQGIKEIRISSEGSIAVPYSLQVSVRDLSLNGGRIVTDQSTPENYYYVDSLDAANPLRIFSFTTNFALFSLLGAFERCPVLFSDFDIQEIAMQQQPTIMEINSLSIPPLAQGRYYIAALGNAAAIGGNYSIGACQGTGCMVSLPPPSSTTTSATNTATTANSETSGGSSMRCFISCLYDISTAWIDAMFIRWPKHVMELWQSPCTWTT